MTLKILSDFFPDSKGNVNLIENQANTILISVSEILSYHSSYIIKFVISVKNLRNHCNLNNKIKITSK